ncbi:hypothetical protein ABFT23_09620 [Nocardioides sp. C4-1]|uniref:hypothetical protein n=1 Tax=Nocardioides sp. C4-1 TaxID=3151851 RepID=UPI003263AA17
MDLGSTLGVLCLVVPVAGFALVAASMVHHARVVRRRRELMSGYAGHREWRFSPSGAGLERRLTGDPFGKGSRRTASNVVEGRYEGRTFLAFDYRYTTSSDDSTSTHPFSVVAMHLGALAQPVPMLQVAPQGTLGRFFRSLFGGDLALGDAAFDARFHVRTTSPELARDVLHPDLRAMLTAYRDRAWRLEGDSLLMVRGGQHSPPRSTPCWPR